jgi:hypothetical protein
MRSPESPTGAHGRRSLAAAAAAAALLGAVVAGARSCGGDDAVAARGGSRPRATVTKAVLRPDPAAPPSWDAPRVEARPAPSSAGWEDEADAVAVDLRSVLEGRARPGAFAEARAEAARRDLALFPPDEDLIRRMLIGGERERTWALAALAARPTEADDIVALVLRSQRPEDGELLRLLGAEICSGLAPEVLSRHEEDVLRAFEREPNPLVVAFALPALERLREDRLRDFMRAQVATAEPEMLPVLLALARDRLGSAAIESVEEMLRATLSEGAGGGAASP